LPYEKKFYAIFALFLAALISMPQRFLLLTTACHKNHFWNKNRPGLDSFRVKLEVIS
jgi:hypothetical protein